VVNIADKRKVIISFNIVALLLFIGLIVFLTIRYTPELKSLFDRRDEIKEYVDQQGFRAVFLFICLQIFQVIVAAVPGEIVQVAGGYFFGTTRGAVFLTFGLIIGSIIAFFAARLLGYRLVKAFVSESKLTKLMRIVSSTKSEMALFILYLFPGIPKDLLTYIAGLTPINPGRFLVLAILGRMPALVVSCYIGASLERENLWAVIIITVATVLLILAGWLFRDKILEKIRLGHHSKREGGV
jgi:uncharacterized membrane protein YdjX (TVP38/TMEM64 family)